MQDITWENFSSYLYNGKNRLKKASYYKSGCRQLIEFLDGREVTPQLITAWFQALEKRNLKGYTLNNYFKMVKHYCRFLNYVLKTDKYSFIEDWKGFSVQPPEIDTLEDEEMDIIIITAYKADYRRAVALETFLRTGMRFNELAGLKWHNFHNDHFKVINRKNNDPLTVELLPDLSHKILKLSGNLYIFGYLDKKLGHNNFNKFVKSCLLNCNLQKYITSHKLRHTFATHESSQGVNHFTIKDLLGQKSIQSTERYIHTSRKTKREAIKKHRLSQYKVSNDEIRKILNETMERLNKRGCQSIVIERNSDYIMTTPKVV